MYAAFVNPVRKTMYAAAIGITLFGASNAYAQERMASTEFSDRATYLETQCAHIKNHADAAGCYAGKAIEYENARAAAARERGAAADQRAAAADQRAAAASKELTCQDTLIDGIKSGHFKKPDVKAVRDQQPEDRKSWCEILGRLKADKLTKG